MLFLLPCYARSRYFIYCYHVYPGHWYNNKPWKTLVVLGSALGGIALFGTFFGFKQIGSSKFTGSFWLSPTKFGSGICWWNKSCTSWYRWFIPLFIGFQPSFWWCRISSINRMLPNLPPRHPKKTPLEQVGLFQWRNGLQRCCTWYRPGGTWLFWRVLWLHQAPSDCGSLQHVAPNTWELWDYIWLYDIIWWFNGIIMIIIYCNKIVWDAMGLYGNMFG